MVLESTGAEFGRKGFAPGFWRAQVMGWLVLATMGYGIRVAVFDNAAAAFWLTLGMDPLAFLLTSSCAALYGRRSSRANASLLALACAALLCLAASALLAAIAWVIHGRFPAGTIWTLPADQFRFSFIYYMGVLSIWTLVYFGVASELAARTERMSKMKAESRALRLELEHLQLQIAPHFLFNALNTIVAEVAERPGIAEEMTRRLAGYLRYSLDRHGQGVCSLAQELEAAEAYIRIQALRFDTQFEYRCQIDPASLDRQILHMTLQGLVENAIKHGVRTGQRDHFLINIRTQCRHDELVVQVDNPGRLQAPYDLAQGEGGLGNLCRRLALRYPGRHAFSLTQRGERTVAEVRFRGSSEPL